MKLVGDKVTKKAHVGYVFVFGFLCHIQPRCLQQVPQGVPATKTTFVLEICAQTKRAHEVSGEGHLSVLGLLN